MKKSLIIVIVIVLVLASGGLIYWFAIRKPKKTDTPATGTIDTGNKAASFAPVVQSQSTGNKIIDDLKLMQKGIEAYLAKFGEYPNTGSKWVGYGIKTGDYSQTREENWFPEIAEFIGGKAPIMNKTNPNESEQAYMYNSNGFGYKLMAHLPPQKVIELVKNNYPELIDPLRNGWAIAIYTEEGKNA